MNKLVIAFALTIAATGCSKNKAVQAAEDMAKAVCACQDAGCAKDAFEKGQAELMKYAHDKGTQSDGEAIMAAMQKATDCISRLH